MKNIVLLFVLEAFSFFIATLNIRACAKGKIPAALATDLLIASNGFILTKLVVEAHTVWEMVGYTLGGGCGSLLGMWLTRRWQD